jgi:hypothetical protein
MSGSLVRAPPEALAKRLLAHLLDQRRQLRGIDDPAPRIDLDRETPALALSTASAPQARPVGPPLRTARTDSTVARTC